MAHAPQRDAPAGPPSACRRASSRRSARAAHEIQTFLASRVGHTCGVSNLVAGAGAAEDDSAPVTIFDMQPDPKAKVAVRQLPRLTRAALAIAWQAGRGEFVASTGLQLIGGLGIAALLLLGQQGLDALLDAVAAGDSLSAVVPWALAIGGVAYPAVLRRRGAAGAPGDPRRADEPAHRAAGARCLGRSRPARVRDAVVPQPDPADAHERSAAAQPRLRAFRPGSSRRRRRRRTHCTHRNRTAAGAAHLPRLPPRVACRVAPGRGVLPVLLAHDAARPGAQLPRVRPFRARRGQGGAGLRTR